jgi:hypothetical protein
MPSGHASTPKTTLQGYTKAVYLTGQQLDDIIEAVRTGLPVEMACREAGTSASQFRIRRTREPELEERFKTAYAEGYENFQHLIENEVFNQAFVEKNWKAVEKLAMVHLPAWAVLRTQRYEHTGDYTLKLQREWDEQFGDMSLAEIQARIKFLEGQKELPVIEQNVA